MMEQEGQETRSISSSSCPPALQTLVFPESACSVPQGTGMSGSYLSGDKGTTAKGGAPGRTNTKMPPKRSTSLMSQGYKFLPTDQGAFDLYGGLDPNPPGSPLNDAGGQGMPFPSAGALGQPKVSPRMLPIRTNRRLSGGNNRAPAKTLKVIDRVNTKTNKLPSAKPVLPDIASQYDRMLMGFYDKLPERSSSTIRIFLSSTFSDFKVERNYLVKHAYPELRKLCEDKGFEFQVLDLRWGITDNAVNDHSVESLCLAEIEHCKHLSPGPNFVSMLGNRYGYRPIPHIIPGTEFEALLAIAKDADLPDVDLLSTWYKKDFNSIPASYILQDIQTLIPHYGDYTAGNKEKRKEATCTWQMTMCKIQEVLRKAAMTAHGRKELDDARLHAYHMSVTEQEVINGLLGAEFAETSCLSFLREIENIKLEDENATRYLDINKTGDGLCVDLGAQALITSLKTSIANKLPSDNIKSYTINWKNGGIDENDTEHAKYLKKMNRDFVDSLKLLITEQINRELEKRRKAVSHVMTIPRPATATKPSHVQSKQKRGKGKMKSANQGNEVMNGAMKGGMSNTSDADFLRGFMAMNCLVGDFQALEKGVNLGTADAKLKQNLYSEISHHLTICKSKCDSFLGREDELAMIRNYVMSQNEAPPMVVTSSAGCGKTSFMAKIAELTKEWLGEHTVTVVRFLGTSPLSSTLLNMLVHLSSHISLAYGEIVQYHTFNHIGKAQRWFMDLLVLISLAHGKRRPLVIVLDSIDLLSSSNKPYLLHWLPKFLPVDVKIIISMTPDVNNCLEFARAHLQSDDMFHSLHLQPLPANVSTRFVEEYPKTMCRQLTENQMQKLVLAAETLPVPLLLKLWMDEACLWNSYTAVSSLNLTNTVSGAIENIFIKLEKKYGKSFVSAALGYVTICLNGISEIELEDVLSCDDTVLIEVFKYHNPPLEGCIRIPPLLWTRLRYDLREYLMEQKSLNRTTLTWYHRQFGEVVAKKYATGTSGKRLHACLADIFLVEKELRRTIELTQRSKTIIDADRLVSPQKLEPSNKRKLTCVAYHLKCSGNDDKLKKEVVCNITFLDCLCRGILNHKSFAQEKALIWQILGDVDEEASHVVHALRLAHPLINMDRSLLAIQLLDMLLPYSSHHAQIASLCKQAELRLQSSESSLTLKPTIGCIGDGISPVNWYYEGPTRVIHQSPDGTTLLLGYSGRGKTVPLCRVFDIQSCQVTHTLMKTNKLVNDILYNGFLSQNNRRAYLLCKRNFVVYSLPENGQVAKIQTSTNNVNGAGSLNETIAVSTNDKTLVLAGPNRLAMFEDTGKSFDEPDFQVRRAMNFSGATATTNIIFTRDETGSITTHTIPGQKRVIGAVACWTFYSQNPCDKVPLPEPVPPGCLKSLPAIAQPECVLVGCADGKLYIISMGLGTILREIKNSVGLRGYSLLLAVHPNFRWVALGSKDTQTVALLDLSEDAMVGHVEAQQTVQAIQMGPDEKHFTVLRRDGVLKLFSVDGLEEKASYAAHEADTTSLYCNDSGHILTCGYDKTLKQFELRKLLNKSESCAALSDEQVNLRLEYASNPVFLLLGDNTILTGSAADPPMAWDLKTGMKMKQLEGGQPGSVNVAVALQGSRIITIDPDSKLATQWEWPSGKTIKFPPNIKDIFKMCVSPDGKKVVFVCEYMPGTLLLVFDLLEGKESLRLILHEKIKDSTQLFMTKNGRYLTFLREYSEEDDDGTERKVVGALTVDTTKNAEQETVWVERDIKTIVPFDSELFLLGEKSGVVVWQPPKILGISDMTKHNGWLQFNYPLSKDKKDTDDVTVSLITVSADDQKIAVVGDDGTLILWQNILKQDPASPKSSHGLHLKMHTNIVTCVTFSPDGRHLASGSTDKTLILWDAMSGSAISQIQTLSRVMDIKFTADGSKILFMRKTAQVQRLSVWDIIMNY